MSPRRCTVCSHHRRDEVDRALVEGFDSIRGIARRFDIGDDAVERHASRHLPRTLAAAHGAAEQARAEDLLAHALDIERRTLSILRRAERRRDSRLALAAVREARGNIELLARLLGQLKEHVVVESRPRLSLADIRGVIFGESAAGPLPAPDGDGRWTR